MSELNLAINNGPEIDSAVESIYENEEIEGYEYEGDWGDNYTNGWGDNYTNDWQ